MSAAVTYLEAPLWDALPRERRTHARHVGHAEQSRGSEVFARCVALEAMLRKRSVCMH